MIYDVLIRARRRVTSDELRLLPQARSQIRELPSSKLYEHFRAATTTGKASACAAEAGAVIAPGECGTLRTLAANIAAIADECAHHRAR